MKYQVFVSYSSKDRDWVEQFEDALREFKIHVFDLRETKPGDLWVDTLMNALRESEYIVPVISTETIRSNYAAAELGAALALGKHLIPIVDPALPADELPGPIRVRRYLPKSDPREVAAQIARTIIQPAQEKDAKHNGDGSREAPQLARIYSPRLLHPEQVKEFKMEVSEETPNV